jgi:hypothetical protein
MNPEVITNATVGNKGVVQPGNQAELNNPSQGGTNQTSSMMDSTKKCPSTTTPSVTHPSLPSPRRLIHTHDPSTGAPILTEDTVPIQPGPGGQSYAMMYVQDRLVSRTDTESVLKGREDKTDLGWVITTGVSSAWIGMSVVFLRCSKGMGAGVSEHAVIWTDTPRYPTRIRLPLRLQHLNE